MTLPQTAWRIILQLNIEREPTDTDGGGAAGAVLFLTRAAPTDSLRAESDAYACAAGHVATMVPTAT